MHTLHGTSRIDVASSLRSGTGREQADISKLLLITVSGVIERMVMIGDWLLFIKSHHRPLCRCVYVVDEYVFKYTGRIISRPRISTILAQASRLHCWYKLFAPRVNWPRYVKSLRIQRRAVYLLGYRGHEWLCIMPRKMYSAISTLNCCLLHYNLSVSDSKHAWVGAGGWGDLF